MYPAPQINILPHLLHPSPFPRFSFALLLFCSNIFKTILTIMSFYP